MNNIRESLSPLEIYGKYIFALFSYLNNLSSINPWTNYGSKYLRRDSSRKQACAPWYAWPSPVEKPRVSLCSFEIHPLRDGSAWNNWIYMHNLYSSFSGPFLQIHLSLWLLFVITNALKSYLWTCCPHRWIAKTDTCLVTWNQLVGYINNIALVPPTLSFRWKWKSPSNTSYNLDLHAYIHGQRGLSSIYWFCI